MRSVTHCNLLLLENKSTIWAISSCWCLFGEFFTVHVIVSRTGRPDIERLFWGSHLLSLFCVSTLLPTLWKNWAPGMALFWPNDLVTQLSKLEFVYSYVSLMYICCKLSKLIASCALVWHFGTLRFESGYTRSHCGAFGTCLLAGISLPN